MLAELRTDILKAIEDIKFTRLSINIIDEIENLGQTTGTSGKRFKFKIVVDLKNEFDCLMHCIVGLVLVDPHKVYRK